MVTKKSLRGDDFDVVKVVQSEDPLGDLRAGQAGARRDLRIAIVGGLDSPGRIK